MLREISHLADGADFAIKPVSFSKPRHEINNTFDVDTTFKRFSSDVQTHLLRQLIVLNTARAKYLEYWIKFAANSHPPPFLNRPKCKQIHRAIY